MYTKRILTSMQRQVRTEKNALALRLERLRAVTSKTWDALASDLGVKRAMLFHVVAGRRGFSEKTLARLLECEVAAGVRSEASALMEQGLSGTDLVTALLHGEGAGQSEVTIEDIDTGSKEVVLEYRRGPHPPGYPTRLKVTAASNAAVWRVSGEKSVREDPSNFLATCLQELDLAAKPDILDRLTPSCYAQIIDTALDLTFGLNWRARLQQPARKRRH
jgi:hypothetical protein